MEIKNILVIRFRRVGDAVLSTVICSSLRQTFPNAQIDFVLNENIVPLYDHHPDIDRVISFTDEENYTISKYICKVWNIMRGKKYDVIIDTRSTVKTLFFSLFSLRSPYRIGTKKKYNILLQNYRIDNHKDIKKDMVQHNLMLLKPLEKITTVKYTSDFRLCVTKEEKSCFRAYMEQQGIDFSRPVVLAAVSARLEYKIWDKEKMKEVLRRMIDVYDVQLIFNFIGSEEIFAQKIHQEMGLDKHIFTTIRANSLRELCALTANCHLFFGNEGGPRHIAQAFKLPSYAIFPPGILKSVWLPASGDRYQGISPDDFYSMEEQKDMDYQQRFNLITMETVWDGVDRFLSHILTKQHTESQELATEIS
jgi:ADP-heptose:LPS heptosyltransferase